MNQYKFPLLFMLLVCFITSCRKDDINTNTDRIPPAPQVNIETKISGTITDSYGIPISGAEVSVINESTQSDQFGYFEMTGLAGEAQAVVKVVKQGYFNQFKAFIPSKDVTDRTRIRLIEKADPQTVSSATGGQVIIEGSTKVDFQANSFIDESGNPYDGEVSVYSFYIDPADTQLDMIMPGNLMARNTENELRLLQSFGMANVELEGIEGQKLNIDKSATLTMNIPSTIVADAPSTIPLWYFDEYTGLWMEEGAAQLTNGQYIGTVDHFTFWSCDIDLDSATLLSGSVSNYGSPFVKVRITNLETGASTFDWTDENGIFDGYVPMNVDLLLELIDICGVNVIHTQNIGPFSDQAIDIGQLNTSSASNFIEISGVLDDCDGQPVSYGQVVVNLPGSYYPQSVNVAVDGSFSFVTAICNTTELEITAIDYGNSVITAPLTYTVAPNMELGSITACEGQSFFGSVTFSYDGETKFIPGCTVDVEFEAGRVLYIFKFSDTQESTGGTAIDYEYRLYDNNNNLNNPFWVYSTSIMNLPSFQDSMRIYENFSLSNLEGDFTLLNVAENPGETLSLQFDNVDLKVNTFYSDGTEVLRGYLDASVVINAVLQ